MKFFHIQNVWEAFITLRISIRSDLLIIQHEIWIFVANFIYQTTLKWIDTSVRKHGFEATVKIEKSALKSSRLALVIYQLYLCCWFFWVNTFLLLKLMIKMKLDLLALLKDNMIKYFDYFWCVTIINTDVRRSKLQHWLECFSRKKNQKTEL